MDGGQDAPASKSMIQRRRMSYMLVVEAETLHAIDQDRAEASGPPSFS
jgi:hypothetical protein